MKNKYIRKCPKCGRIMISQVEYYFYGQSILVYHCLCGHKMKQK